MSAGLKPVVQGRHSEITAELKGFPHLSNLCLCDLCRSLYHPSPAQEVSEQRDASVRLCRAKVPQLLKVGPTSLLLSAALMQKQNSPHRLVAVLS